MRSAYACKDIVLAFSSSGRDLVFWRTNDYCKQTEVRRPAADYETGKVASKPTAPAGSARRHCRVAASCRFQRRGRDFFRSPSITRKSLAAAKIPGGFSSVKANLPTERAQRPADRPGAFDKSFRNEVQVYSGLRGQGQRRDVLGTLPHPCTGKSPTFPSHAHRRLARRVEGRSSPTHLRQQRRAHRSGCRLRRIDHYGRSEAREISEDT